MAIHFLFLYPSYIVHLSFVSVLDVIITTPLQYKLQRYPLRYLLRYPYLGPSRNKYSKNFWSSFVSHNGRSPVQHKRQKCVLFCIHATKLFQFFSETKNKHTVLSEISPTGVSTLPPILLTARTCACIDLAGMRTECDGCARSTPKCLIIRYFVSHLLRLYIYVEFCC
jgi:hypothetical protein